MISLDSTGPSNITGFSAPDLLSIDGSLTLSETHLISLLQLPSLKSVGEIYMLSTWALSSMELDAGVDSISNLTLDNTSMNNLTGISPTNMIFINIINNGFLNSIDLPVETVSEFINILGLADDLEVNLPNLNTANNITLAAVNKVELPNLVAVNQSIGLFGNTIDQFNAPLLQTIEGDLQIWDNSDLTILNLPALTTVGDGIIITNNTALDRISGLDALETVTSGGFRVDGDFVELDLPKIESVGGTFFVISSDLSYNCSGLNAMLGGDESAFQGSFYCNNAFQDVKGGLASTSTTGSVTNTTAAPASSSSSSTNSNKSGGSSSFSTGAKAAIAVVCIVAAIAATGVLVFFLRKKRPTRMQTKEADVKFPDSPPPNSAFREMEAKEIQKINELDSKQRAAEMGNLARGREWNPTELE